MVPILSFGEFSSLLEIPRHGSQSLLDNSPLFWSFPDMFPSLSFREFSSLLELPRHGSQSLFWRILLSFGASLTWFPVSLLENSPLFWSFLDKIPSLSFGEFSSDGASPTCFLVSNLENSPLSWSFPDMVPSLSFGEFSSLFELPRHGSQSLFWRILLSFDLPLHGSQSLFWRILLSFRASKTWFPVSLLENSPLFWSFPDMVHSLSFGEFSSLLELPRHGSQSLFRRILHSFGASPTWFPVSLLENSPLFWSFPDMFPSLSFGEFSSLWELPRHGSQSLF